MKKLILSIASLVVCNLCFASSGDNKNIDALCKAFMHEYKIDGMSVAVINNNETQIFNYGSSTNQTIYTIASFTKTFTAELAAVAEIENKLKLDESFYQYLPKVWMNPHLQRMTSSMLLGHTASLPFDFSPRPMNIGDIILAYLQFIPPYEPGTQYSYSNASIGTMGYVLQRVYKKSYQEILNEKLLNPLHMHSTYLFVPIDKERFIAIGHDKDNNDVEYDKNIEAWFAAASLKSSIKDLALYLSAQIHPDLVADKTLSQAIKLVHHNKYCFTDQISCEQLAWQAHDISQLNNSITDTYFKNYDENGFPVFDKKQIINTDTLENHQIFIDKTGSGYGMSSYMAYMPDKKIGVVILLNKTPLDARVKLGRDILLAESS